MLVVRLGDIALARAEPTDGRDRSGTGRNASLDRRQVPIQDLPDDGGNGHTTLGRHNPKPARLLFGELNLSTDHDEA
jgi:hypothetical protein